METKQDLFKLSGVLKKVLYLNHENSYIIAVLENNQKICGQYFDADIQKLVGEEIVLNGNWQEHKKYGTQFVFETLKIKEKELYFFLTKIVKGFSKKSAKELLEAYSEEELIDILNNNPQKLLGTKGIKEKKLQNILKSWHQFKHLRELGSFLSKHGVSGAFITKIYNYFEDVENLIDKIKQNPYMLIKIKGIGFKRADEIGTNLGIDKKSDFRVAACVDYSLKEYCENFGNSSIGKEQLFKLLDESLNFVNENILYEKILQDMLNKNEIYQTKIDRYSPSMLYFAENKILDFFKKRQNYKISKKIVSNLKHYLQEKEKTYGFTLSAEQANAVETINNGANTLFLIGYAGTGKSTSSRAILELLQEIYSYDEIITTALSGIAAQRISDTTGYKSSTIHSLILKHKDSEKFPYKVILLDEASMVNSMIFYQLISKISNEAIFIIVGDDGQLPAIGAGNVLHDCIKYNLAQVCKLEKIYRQSPNQAIAILANEIRQGKVPNYKEEYEDFKFYNISIPNYYKVKNGASSQDFAKLRFENSQNILNSILNTASSYLESVNMLIKQKQIAKALTLFQIITPIKNGVLGVENLNKEMQKLFNSVKNTSYKTRLYEYKLGDKVIHIKNENMKAQSMDNYKNGLDEFVEIRVFNGQLGLIIKLNFEENLCIVLYPNDNMVVFYDFDTLENLLNLAYCLTIHKTQGMEYETALIPMSFSHYIMHNTKLLYTAITRAKKMCYIIGEEDAFASACKKLENTKRESVINDILFDSVQKE